MQSFISVYQLSSSVKLTSLTPEGMGACYGLDLHNRWSAWQSATVGACLASWAWIDW